MRVHSFCNLQSRAQTLAVLVMGLYELLGNPTAKLNEPHVPLIIHDLNPGSSLEKHNWYEQDTSFRATHLCSSPFFRRIHVTCL
jgi:hypothetical protein